MSFRVTFAPPPCPKPSSSIDVQNDDFLGGAYTLASIEAAN
jgi:hypothetical protein